MASIAVPPSPTAAFRPRLRSFQPWLLLELEKRGAHIERTDQTQAEGPPSRTLILIEVLPVYPLTSVRNSSRVCEPLDVSGLILKVWSGTVTPHYLMAYADRSHSRLADAGSRSTATPSIRLSRTVW
jgi:hypothetical protein